MLIVLCFPHENPAYYKSVAGHQMQASVSLSQEHLGWSQLDDYWDSHSIIHTSVHNVLLLVIQLRHTPS